MTVAERDRVHALWGSCFDQAGTDTSHSTVAIYAWHEKRVHLNGSGVLLNIGDGYFLVSAAHVLDLAMIHKIGAFLSPTVLGEEPIQVDGVACGTSPLPPHRDRHDVDMRDDDPYDVGFVELNQEMVNRLLPVRRFVTLREVDVDDGLRRGCYLVLGFPKARLQREVNQDCVNLRADPLHYLTELCDDPQDEFDPTFQVRLKYPEIGLADDRKEMKVPHPRGLSGCGIWRLADMKPSASWSRDDVKLAAIDHMWHGERRYV
jgi:hypothetical protein